LICVEKPPDQLLEPAESATVPNAARLTVVVGRPATTPRYVSTKGEPATTEQDAPTVVTLAQFVFDEPLPKPSKVKSRSIGPRAGKTINSGTAPPPEVRFLMLPVTPATTEPPEKSTFVPKPVLTHPVPGEVPTGDHVISVAVTVTPPPGQLAIFRVPIGLAAAVPTRSRQPVKDASVSCSTSRFILL